MSQSATHTNTHAALLPRGSRGTIAIHLPFQGIIAATGIRRAWRTALLGDPNIREDLFLKPAEVRLVLADPKHVRETANSIPLDECYILGTALPLLRNNFDSINFDVGNVMFIASAKRALLKPHFTPQMPSSASEIANTFWRDMLITQFRIFTCEDKFKRSIGDPLYDVKLQRVDGIKLADLYDIFQSRLGEEHNQYFTFLSVLN